MSTLNFNIGVLGHVDSGKTSLAKALSTVASTACFDKNPQSKQRGITLDLGFSSFTIDASSKLKQSGYDFVQYTLVDCPGHASLIKTIIGGAQIIDMMLLVIDIVKGIQTQTAECLIIGEICCDKLLIVLNKLDLIEEPKREAMIEKISKRLLKTLETTKFANSPIVAVAANSQLSDSSSQNLTQAVEALTITNEKPSNSLNIGNLIDQLREITFLPERKNVNGSFLFAVDHCFTIKGQGTVMTGTVLDGQVKINDNIEIPAFKQQKKVKSIQIFRKSVDKAIQGDRCGICLANFDSKQFERGIICAPNHVKTAYALIINLEKIKHYKHSIESGSKFHITIGHETLIGKIELFGLVDTNQNFVDASKSAASNTSINSKDEFFDFNKDYLHLNEFMEPEKDEANKENDTTKAMTNNENDKQQKLKPKILKHFALIDFTHDSDQNSSVLCTLNSLLIGSKLDTDIHLNQCRIAFYGRVLHLFSNKDFRESASAPPQTTNNNASSSTTTSQTNFHLTNLRVYKEKQKEGVIERKQDEYTLIGKALFKKETNIDLFVGLKVTLSTGEKGTIEGSFGQSGKFKIRVSEGLSKIAKEILDGTGKKGKNAKAQETNAADSMQNNDGSGALSLQQTANNTQIKVYLNFKRYIYDDKKKMIQ